MTRSVSKPIHSGWHEPDDPPQGVNSIRMWFLVLFALVAGYGGGVVTEFALGYHMHPGIFRFSGLMGSHVGLACGLFAALVTFFCLMRFGYRERHKATVALTLFLASFAAYSVLTGVIARVGRALFGDVPLSQRDFLTLGLGVAVCLFCGAFVSLFLTRYKERPA